MPRAIAKTATYGAMHFTIAVIVAFLVTRSWVAALSVGVLEPFGAYEAIRRLSEATDLELAFHGHDDLG